MPDREKVIRKLKEALENAENEGEIFAEVRRPVLFDALAMLKEQQEYIEYWSAKYDEYGKAYMKVRDERDALLKDQENEEKRNTVIVCPHCGKRVK